jgi:hypothetical protein
MLSPGKLISVSLSLFVLCAIFFPAPAYCEGDPIAHLTDFTGTVLINSQSSWGVKPAKNFPLYSMDKVVTRVGTAVITFADGAVIEIKNNTNLLIQEMEKEEGLIKKAKIVQRRIILFLGKMFFKTGKGHVQTQFETEKSVIGIRGTAGVLSIGADGQIYIEFTEGSAKFTVGDLILGKVAKDVPKELVDQNPIQKAAYMAHAAWKQCGEAKEKSSKGEILPGQMEWACAYAVEMSSREVETWAEALVQNNPSEDVVEWAKEIIVIEDISIEKAIEGQEQAVESGAVPEPIDVYTPPETGGEAEGYEEPEGEAEAFFPAKEVISGPLLQGLDQNLERDDTAASPTAPQ